MINTLTHCDFFFPGQLSHYKGKVRDVYELEGGLLVIVASDRLSAFDVVMPRGIPYKGQILNQISKKTMSVTEDIVPNWLTATPDPNVSIGHHCKPFKIEMVIRACLSGHAAREYIAGKRSLCGVDMPDGMIENDYFPTPIITPTTKAYEGHDEDISREAIMEQGIVSESDYLQLEKYTRALFKRGNEIAQSHDLILVDTKYEFGKSTSGEIILLDEIHTPDSSRYFYENGYDKRQINNMPQKQLSKEFVRKWLISEGFQGLKKQKLPEFTSTRIESISNRDLPTVQALAIILASIYVSINLLADLLTLMLNPRLKTLQIRK